MRGARVREVLEVAGAEGVQDGKAEEPGADPFQGDRGHAADDNRRCRVRAIRSRT
jgi:hypothetical protein